MVFFFFFVFCYEIVNTLLAEQMIWSVKNKKRRKKKKSEKKRETTFLFPQRRIRHVLYTHLFANSRENDEKGGENRTENQTRRYHLYVAGDGRTVTVTVEHGSAVAPEPLHSVNGVKKTKQNKYACSKREFFLLYRPERRASFGLRIFKRGVLNARK